MKEIFKSKKGISIPIVMAVAVILLVTGGTVLYAASGNLSTANEEKNNKQAYFIARSSLEVIDESLQDGALGAYIKNLVLEDLISNGGSQVKDKSWGPIQANVKFSQDSGSSISGFSVKNMEISFISDAAAGTGTGENLQNATVSINNLVVSFKAVYNSRESYGVKAKYSYSGYANIVDGQKTWGSEEWTLVDIE